MKVLSRQRQIQGQRMPERFAIRRQRLLSQDQIDRISRRQMGEKKNERRNREENRNQKKNPFEEIVEHYSL
jgi:hypothetical protein